jgi:hypothetical protein
MPTVNWIGKEAVVNHHHRERKVRVAARLRKETTMSLKWIAQHLEMGSWRTFPTCLEPGESRRV